MMLYKHNKVDSVMCSICGIKRKHEYSLPTRFIKCPSPHLLQPYLNEAVDFEGHLLEGDLVCSSCYKFANHIVKSDAVKLSSVDTLHELVSKECDIFVS